MISFGIYILATVWSVPTDFFRVTGIVVVLFGIILILIAHMGMQGIGMQNKRYGRMNVGAVDEKFGGVVVR